MDKNVAWLLRTSIRVLLWPITGQLPARQRGMTSSREIVGTASRLPDGRWVYGRRDSC